MKRLCIFIAAALLSCHAFAEGLEEKVPAALTKIIPAPDKIIQVETPVYKDTSAASEFSPYLKEAIEIALTELQKEVFDRRADEQAESFIAELNDSGYTAKEQGFAERQMPDGSLTVQFSERNNTVQIVFRYYQFFQGNSKTTNVSLSTKNLPGLSYQPANYELAKTMHADVQAAQTAATREPEKTIGVFAIMLDAEGNTADILYPDSRVSFLVGTPQDAYIAIKNIDAYGMEFWLATDVFIEGGTNWRSPMFHPVDNVYGQELIYIYAASTQEGLRAAMKNSSVNYQPKSITGAARALVLDASTDDVATGVFALPYTVLPAPLE